MMGRFVCRELVVVLGRPEHGEWEYVLWLPSANRSWRA